MKYLTESILIMSWLVSMNISYAQNYEIIGSLSNELDTTRQDEKRVHLLNELSWEWRLHDFDKASGYALEAMELAEKIGDRMGESTAWARLGQTREYHKKFDGAIAAYQTAYAIDTSIGHDYGMARAVNQMAVILREQGKYRESLQFCNRSIELFEKLNSSHALANAYLNRGFNHREIAQEKEALEDFSKSLKLWQNLNDSLGMAKSYLAIGVLYQNQNRYRQAIMNYREALNIQLRAKYNSDIGATYTNMGTVYFFQDKLDSALYFFEKSLEESGGTLSKDQKANNYHNIAAVYLEKGDRVNALDFCHKGLETREEIRDTLGIVRSHLLLGKIHYDKQDYNQAINSFKYSAVLAEQMGSKKLMAEVFQNLAKGFQANSDFPSALSSLWRTVNLKDSIAINENTAFEFESMQQEVALLRKDNALKAEENARKTISLYALIAGTILIVFIFILFILFYRRRKDAIIANKNEQLALQRLENLMKDQELNHYSAMIEGEEKERERIARDLHDEIGATLAMVRNYFSTFEKPVENLGPENVKLFFKADDLLKNAIGKVREISHNIGNSLLDNHGLERALKNLARSVEESSSLIVGIYSFGLEGRLDRKLETNIYKIVLELLTNILKHAQATEATVQLLQNEDTLLTVTVEDNGKGFDPAKLKDSKSMGLLNIRSRLKKINGQLEIDSGLGRGTHITLRVPVIANKNEHE